MLSRKRWKPLNMKNHLIDEMWRDIKGYEGLYQVSNFGKVKSLNKSIIRNNGRKQTFKEKTLKEGLSGNGYYSVSLTKNGKGKTFNIHKLVAIAFIENKNNDKCVNHIDGNKLNNTVGNLEWVTSQENVKHAYATGLISTDSIDSRHLKISKAVIRIDKQQNKKYYDSIYNIYIK